MNSMQQSRQQTKANTIKSKIKEKQARNPSMTFQHVWEELQREQPHLLEPDLDSDDSPSPSQQIRAHIDASGGRNPFGTPLPPEPREATPLSKRINELMRLNEGLDLKTALEYLRNEEPELFPADEQPEHIRQQTKLRDRVQKLHDAIDSHRKKNPHHDFAMAYQAVTQAHPELVRGLTRTFDSGDDDDSGAGISLNSAPAILARNQDVRTLSQKLMEYSRGGITDPHHAAKLIQAVELQM